MIRNFAVIAAVLFASSAHAEILHHWTQLIDEDRLSFRVIVDDDSCPTMSIDGDAHPMEVRAAPTTDFPNIVCEQIASGAIASAVIGVLDFPLRPASPERIIVVGDTGCRLKSGSPVQACNDPTTWPFATIARSLAATEADLAIHIGDYVYREMACPDAAVCGTVFGDNWGTWEADFFAPGQVMLTAHPFVFLRGDHERCGRQWLGYLRYLAPQSIRVPLMCDNYLSPFIVTFDNLQMAVLDSSTRNRGTYTRDRFRAMRDQFLAVSPRLDDESWLLTHAPLWGYGQTEADATDLVTLETIQREAFSAMLPRAMSAVISGDLHFAQMVSAPDMPVQITIGNGGAAAYTTPVGHADGMAVGNGILGDVFGVDAFGFALIDRAGDVQRLTLFNRLGGVVATCVVDGGARSCASE